ncbi:5-dehydro-2-deoxygluconokinase [Streptomyces sp. NBC_01216]|uniref:5-dehydro-2-deoxygluconokinase n=1 Tax=unclassified Streptomyces TaxID=2593676 RepID=UPI002E0FB3D6|nr:5-dehydro-2-deoxygluconokinase [Streptomyces sp. NBC_01216]
METEPDTAPYRAPQAEPYDLITMGRIGVDLYPLQVGVPLARVESFGKFLGGSPSNVAVAASRLGRRTAVITRTGADPFGDYLHRELRAFGVDDRWVTPVAAYPTPVTFCEIFPPDDFPIHFYRQPKAPDLEIHPHELDLATIRSARAFWVTGTGLSAEPSRTATLRALRERDGDGLTVLDLDWRPALWADPTEAGPLYREALREATVAVGNLDECEVATGEREPHAAARALLDAGVRLAVVKQGPAGVLALSADGACAEVRPLPVEVVNGLGAGDAFGGALAHGLLAGWGLERTLRWANAAGAIVAGRLACSPAMPCQDEITQALATGTGAVPERPASEDPAERAGPVPRTEDGARADRPVRTERAS